MTTSLTYDEYGTDHGVLSGADGLLGDVNHITFTLGSTAPSTCVENFFNDRLIAQFTRPPSRRARSVVVIVGELDVGTLKFIGYRIVNILGRNKTAIQTPLWTRTFTYGVGDVCLRALFLDSRSLRNSTIEIFQLEIRRRPAHRRVRISLELH